MEQERADPGVAGARVKPESFTCPKCELTSHNSLDVHEKYCGACHEWFNDYGPMHYDRTGKPISMNRWVELRHDYSYTQLGESYIGRTLVSTIWLGVGNSFGGGNPIIFETMVFGRYGDLGQWRFAAEEEAILWHDLVVRSLRGTQPRKMKKRMLRLNYGGTWGDIKNRSHWRVRSSYMRPYSNPQKLSKPGLLVSRKYHARKTRKVRR